MPGQPEMSDVEIIAAAIAEVSGRPAATIAGALTLTEDIGLDSLEFIKVVQTVEDMSMTRIPDDLAAQAKTVEDLVRVLEQARLTAGRP